nr:Fanconi anemia group I protein [Hymenolepis microstoma]
MTLSVELLEKDAERFVLELETQSRPSIQNFLQELWKTEYTLDRLTGLESVLYELARSEEVLEACEDVIKYLWTNSVTTQYLESVATFLLQCVVKSLCNAAVYTYTSNDRISGSAFLRKVCLPLPDPETVVEQIVNFSGSELNSVVTGLIQHCFALLKSATPPSIANGLLGAQNRCGLAAAKSRRALSARKFVQQQQQMNGVSSASSKLSPKFRISRLAINALTEVFQAKLIGELAALCPVEFAESASEPLSRIFDCLGVFPLEVSTALLHALLPLFVVSVAKTDAAKGMTALAELQLRVITTLRKMATTYSVPVRRIAVAGFISLLKNLRVRSSNFRTASQQSWSMSSQSEASSQSWFNSIATFSQVPTSDAFLLFSQIKSTQVAQAVAKLPSNLERNESLCTEIVSLLHRLINSTFFGGTSGTLLSDPSALVKSDIYWGLCEVAVSNRGLVGPVLTLFTRLLSACIEPALSNYKPVFKDGAFILPQTITAVPLKLSQLISIGSGSESERYYRDHPEVLVWCLQILLSLPLLRHHWTRFGSSFVQPGSSLTSGSSQFTQSCNSILLSQSALFCGSFGLSMRIFNRAASLLLNLSASLRETALDEFGLTSDIDLGSSAAGQANQARLMVLLGLYDACLEFEAKNLLNTVTDSGATWSHLKRLFSRREAARKLFFRLPDKDEEEQTKADDTLAGNTVSTSANEVSTNICFVGTSEGRLRGALLVSGLRSIVAALPRALLSTSTAPAFALQLLQTTCARLAELTAGVNSQQQSLLSVVYRSTFIRIVARILRLAIRFYSSYLDDVEGEETQKKSSLISSTATAALQTCALCFSVVADSLGSKRLLTLVTELHSVATAPKPLSEEDLDCGNGEEIVEPKANEGNIEIELSVSEQTVTNQSRSLTSLVKLFKGWVTRVLNLTSSSLGVGSADQSMNRPMANTLRGSCSLITDLTILLPMLIRLCEARTNVLSATSAASSITSSAVQQPDFSGLDRVLVWLLRLITSKEVFEGKTGIQVGSQTMRLTLHLARLLGSANSTGNSNGGQRRSSAGISSLAELTWDDIIVLLASDIRTTLGSIENDISESGNRSSSSSVSSSHIKTSKLGRKSMKITFPMLRCKSAVNSLFQILMPALTQALDDLSWLVESVNQEIQRDILESGLFVSAPKSSDITFTNLPDARRSRELAICDMLLTFGEVLDELLQTSIQPAFAYEYISLIQRNFGTFPSTFERVVRLFGRQVSPHSYAFVYFIQIREAENLEVKPPKRAKTDSTLVKPKNPAPSKTMISRNLKDAKLIPQLIFAVEQYESLLSTLSKKSKVTLVDNIRMGLSRDFRINQSSALAILEAEIEAAPDPLDAELPPISEPGTQRHEGNEEGDEEDEEEDEEEAIADTDNEESADLDEETGGPQFSVPGHKRPIFRVKYHSRK